MEMNPTIAPDTKELSSGMIRLASELRDSWADCIPNSGDPGEEWRDSDFKVATALEAAAALLILQTHMIELLRSQLKDERAKQAQA